MPMREGRVLRQLKPAIARYQWPWVDSRSGPAKARLLSAGLCFVLSDIADSRLVGCAYVVMFHKLTSILVQIPGFVLGFVSD